MKISRLILLAAALILAISVAATASGRYQLTLVNNSNYYPSYNGTIWTSLAQSQNVAIGPVYIQIYDTVMNTTTNTNMLCIDLSGTINWGTTWEADIVTGTPTTVINSTAWDRVVYMVQHNTEWTDTKTSDDSPTLKIQKSAIQVAVWEAISDGTWDINRDLGMGNFALGNISGDYSGAIRSSIASTAQGYYDDAVANAVDGYGSTHSYYLAVCSSKQDLIFFVPNYSPPDVPEVPTMLLGSIGLTMIGIIRRKVTKH
ncbi:hypothetical protein LLG46_14480 [bacterium]|nr:hypothetical protein [bacterium]